MSDGLFFSRRGVVPVKPGIHAFRRLVFRVDVSFVLAQVAFISYFPNLAPDGAQA
jgi:hypothetical protein